MSTRRPGDDNHRSAPGSGSEGVDRADLDAVDGDSEQMPPPQPDTPVQKSEPAAKVHSVPHLQMKALALFLFTLTLVAGSALYLMYSRGVFSPKQTLILVAEDSEGVLPGMDMTFSGFPIGRVRHVDLGDEGKVRITVDVNKEDAKWLRTSSVFTLVRGLFGAPQLRAYSGVLVDPPLPDNAVRSVLSGDAQAELQRVIGAARDTFDNLNEMTRETSELQRTIGNLQIFSSKLAGRQGALHAVFGNEDDARRLVAAIERANTAMASIEKLAQRAEAVVGKADAEVFGPDGIARDARGALGDARGAIREAHALLSDARTSLKRVDAVLQEVQGVGGNVRAATQDLGAMRQDVEANLRKIEDLINDLNRKWPFAKERKIELP